MTIDAGPGLSAVIRGAARVAGVVADAVVVVDPVEHERRQALGAGGIMSLAVLDALMCLPLGADIPVAALGDVTLAMLRQAPAGAVQWGEESDSVRRAAVPAASIPLVRVRATTWRGGLRQSAAFLPCAEVVMVVTSVPAKWASVSWEAATLGIGVSLHNEDTGEETELLPSAPYVPLYVKPAGWRFRENAYECWLRSRRPAAS
jgi:hypothetical protein